MQLHQLSAGAIRVEQVELPFRIPPDFGCIRLPDEPVSVHPRLAIGNDLRVEGFWLGAWAKQQGVLTMLRLFRRVRGLMREGVLQTHFAATYPIEEVAKAVEHAAAPGKGGKVLLKIGDR